jgi:hypothetical protein
MNASVALTSRATASPLDMRRRSRDLRIGITPSCATALPLDVRRGSDLRSGRTHLHGQRLRRRMCGEAAPRRVKRVTQGLCPWSGLRPLGRRPNQGLSPSFLFAGRRGIASPHIRRRSRDLRISSTHLQRQRLRHSISRGEAATHASAALPRAQRLRRSICGEAAPTRR